MLLFMVMVDQEDRDKLTILYEQYKRDLYIKALSLLRDRDLAEDMVQDAFIRVSKHLDKINVIKSNKTRSYLVIIVKNLCIDYLRKKGELLSSDYEVMKNNIQDISDTPEEILLKLNMTEEMTSNLAKLNPSYVEVITLKYYHGLNGKEIAQQLNISEVNVRVRLKRSLSALRRMMEEKEEGPYE